MIDLIMNHLLVNLNKSNIMLHQTSMELYNVLHVAKFIKNQVLRLWNPEEDLEVYVFFIKFSQMNFSVYLYKSIPKKSHQYITRNVNDIATYQCRTDAFKCSFFLGLSLNGIKQILKFEILHIQFSETICSTQSFIQYSQSIWD